MKRTMISGIKSFRGILQGMQKSLGLEDPYMVRHPWVRPHLEKVIDALSMSMFPAGGEIPYSAKDVGMTAYILDFLTKIPADKSNLLCALLLGYEYAIPALFAKGFRFSHLSERARIEILEILHDSSFYPLRMFNLVLRMFFTFGYVSDARVLREMGFFKRHEYPMDRRMIQILEQLPWEGHQRTSTGEERETKR